MLYPINRYLDNLGEFAAVGDKLYVRVNGVDDEGRLSLAYVAREQDRPKPPNRRQRRRAERGESETVEAGEKSRRIFRKERVNDTSGTNTF